MTERTFAATDENLNAVLGFVEEELEALDCPMKLVMQITVSVEELFVNIAHYAYPGGQGDMQLAIWDTDGVVSIRFSDHGIPFDPLAKADPDVTLSAEQRRIGGLGIYMVKKSMDSVHYVWEDGQNILTIAKKIR